MIYKSRYGAYPYRTRYISVDNSRTEQISFVEGQSFGSRFFFPDNYRSSMPRDEFERNFVPVQEGKGND